jgi:hypothetical protein
MTADEKRQERAMLLLDHKEALQELGMLRSKAARMAGSIRPLMQILKRASGDGSGPVENSSYGAKPPLLSNSLSPELEKAVDFQAAKQIILEIEQAEAKVDDLQKRKEAAGL